LSRSELEFLEALLALAATSIANARAHQEVLARNQELRGIAGPFARNCVGD
jgi:GAF domain-containing protein